MALNLRPHGAHAEISKEGINLLAIGDFGTGATDQKAVSKAMQDFVVQNRFTPDALLLIGDNFYGPANPKPKGKPPAASEDAAPFNVNSKRWRTDIEEMYPKSAFPCPQYAVLGNHDYHDNKGGEKIQLAYSQLPGVRWKMPGKWYRLDLGRDVPLVTLICLDSNLPLVSGGKDKKSGQSRGSLTQEESDAQLAWLKTELAKPRAPFTLVMAHHPIYSNGDHGDTKSLIEQWEPLLQEHRVHAYLCGHDHDLQHLEMEGKFTSHILSGGGGAKTRKLEHPERKMPYGRDIHGFTHISAQRDELTFSHHGVEGTLLHRFTKRTDGRVEIA